MSSDVENDVKIAWRAAIVTGLAFARHAEPRVRIDPRRNSQIDCPGAFDAALAPAVRTGLTHDLSRAAAIRARAGDREKTLLVMNLPAPAAGHTGNDSCALFRTGSVADFAEFQTRQPDFRVDAVGRLFKAQFHVVPQVRAPLRTVARAASAKNILESKKIAKDVLKFVENGLIDAAVKAAARKSCKAEAVVGGALLRFRKDRVRFGGFAELLLCFLLLRRVAVRMPLQGCLTIGGFNFVGRSGTFDSEHFVTVTFLTHWRIELVSLIFHGSGIGVLDGMDADADNRGPENTSVKHVPILKEVEDKSVRMIFRFDTLDGLVHVRIEYLVGGIDAFHAVAR